MNWSGGSGKEETAVAAKDYYEALGVSRGATRQEIKKAYQKLAKAWHPDVNKAPGAEEKFKEAAEAYEVLGNEDKRKAYDEQLQYGFGGGATRGAQGGRASSDYGGSPFGGGWSFSSSGPGMSGDDLFGMFFGSGKGGQGGFGFFDGAEAGGGARAELEIPLEQAYQGGTVRVGIAGKDVSVNIPPRSADGTVIRVPDGGGQGAEVRLVLRIAPHEVFTPDGGDLRGAVEIAPWQAVLGGEAKVPLPDGSSIKLKIPPGLAGGKTLRLSGKGLKRADGGNGDVLFALEMVAPAPVTEAQRQLYRQLAAESGFQARAKRQAAGLQHRKAAMG